MVQSFVAVACLFVDDDRLQKHDNEAQSVHKRRETQVEEVIVPPLRA
jgi:hypothetical protein